MDASELIRRTNECLEKTRTLSKCPIGYENPENNIGREMISSSSRWRKDICTPSFELTSNLSELKYATRNKLANADHSKYSFTSDANNKIHNNSYCQSEDAKRQSCPGCNLKNKHIRPCANKNVNEEKASSLHVLANLYKELSDSLKENVDPPDISPSEMDLTYVKTVDGSREGSVSRVDDTDSVRDFTDVHVVNNVIIPNVESLLSSNESGTIPENGDAAITTVKMPTEPFTSWRGLVYYIKSEEHKDNRRGGSAKSIQKHRRVLSSKLNNSLTMDVDVDNDLQCPICLELYTYPIILPCSHVLCRSPCAEHLFDFNFIRCPVCRDNCYVSGGIGSLPRVIALENIIDRYKNEQKKERSSESSSKSSCSKRSSPTSSVTSSIEATPTLPITSSKVETDIKCQHCKNGSQRRAKKLCVTCCKHYCASCLRLTHPNKEPFASHELAEPGTSVPCIPKSSSSSGSRKLITPSLPGFNPKIIDAYCRICAQPFSLNSEDASLHENHSVISIEEAYREYKKAIEESSDKLSTSQTKVVTSLKLLKDRLKDIQHVLTRRRDDINMHCDALLAEIENKRSYFLADLEYEERINQTSMEDNIKMMEKMLGASQGLQGYVQDMMAADKPQFLEIANTLNERLSKATIDCDSTSSTLPLDSDVLQNKVVDCRREKVLLRELTYLSLPSTPIVDVTRCSRSENAVVLALCPPNNMHDVVDQYEVHFCSEEQKNIEVEETQVMKNFVEDSCSTKISANTSGIQVVLIENLCRSTTYYFCLSASNSAGKSASSEVVQCTTLMQDENVIPVPSIIDSLCKQFTSSIQIFSSSPMDVTPEQKISHFLLYRQPANHRVWKCVSMYGREEHRVFGLEPNTEYEFVILAYNLRGECQLSNKVTMETETGANF